MRRFLFPVMVAALAAMFAGKVVEPADAQTPSSGGFFTPIGPTRVLDTRDGTGGVAGPLAGGQTISVQVTNVAAVPADAVAVAFNVTAVSPTASGWLTIWPSDAAQPEVSSVNFVAGQTVPNLVQMRSGPDGRINITTPSGSVHVLVDIAGFYGTTSGARFFPDAPIRAFDSRARNQPIPPQGTLTLLATALPNSGRTTAIAHNVTVVSGNAPGYATVYSGDRQSAPETSNLNFGPNQAVANFVINAISGKGEYRIFNGSDAPIHVIIDSAGFFVLADLGSSPYGRFHPITPTRSLDTRRTFGVGGNGPIGSNAVRDILVTSVAGLPGAADVLATVMNATVTQPSAEGWIRIWSGGSQYEPDTSNVNFSAGQTVANHAIVEVPTFLSGGSIRNASGDTHVILDITGYYADDLNQRSLGRIDRALEAKVR